MSQSPTSEDKTSAAEYFRNWEALGLMIARGNSFSGNERNCVFLNTGQERFADVSAATRLDFPDDARAVALTDWDHDGDIDFWIANRTAPRLRLLRNDIQQDNSFVSIRLQGKECNRDAIGARVEVTLEGASTRRLSETARAGSGFLTQSTKWLHFGLQPVESVANVRIRWPGDTTWEVISGVNAGSRYTVTQGSGRATQVPSTRATLAIKPGPIDTIEPSAQTRVVLSKRVLMPSLVYEDFAGEQKVIEAEPNSESKATLVNLWASWCQPCLKELAEFAQHKDDITRSGLQIIALSTDGIESETSTESAAQTAFARGVLESIDFPFAQGVASGELLTTVSSVKSRVLYKERPLPLPSSFLLDATGRLAILYSGPVEVSQLLQDMQLLDSSQEKIDDEALPGTGKFVFRSTAINPLAIADAYMEAEYFEDAKREMVEILARWDSVDSTARSESSTQSQVEAYRRLATIESKLENETAAADAWQKALTLMPSSSSLRMSLAMSLGRQADFTAARAEFDRVIRQSPSQPEIHFLVGRKWLELKRPSDAILAFQNGLQLDPNQPILQFAIASTLQGVGKTADAIRQYETLIQLQDNTWAARASNNLAWIRATHYDATFRNGRAAVELAKAACTLTQNRNAKFIGTLGAAYAEDGQFERAVAATKHAMKLDPNNVELLASLQHRLDLYEREKPYHAAEE